MVENREGNGLTDVDRTARAECLMGAFAERTGLTSDNPPRRYLWTDAFAVCNFTALARQTGSVRHRDLTLHLIEQVHQVLGRHRADDTRSGWISGLDEAEGRKHPTRGGLRIGKSLPERRPDEPQDAFQEWDRDGQYFHYLTRWMQALDVAARYTGDARCARWSVELAQAAADAFVYRHPTGLRMYWKMRIDLSRPLVPSMGLHDPLDGYITLLQLQSTAGEIASGENGPEPADLNAELGNFAEMIAGRNWTTPDPLGIGGLLIDATRLMQLIQKQKVADDALLMELLDAAEAGLRHWRASGALAQPAAYRLAFRELGLAIGLHGVRWMRDNLAPAHGISLAGTSVPLYLDRLAEFLPLGADIESFWIDPANRHGRTWTEHEDINAVMLATALVPHGCLVLPAPAALGAQ